MHVALVGLPGSGKTTVFNALTGGRAETGGFGGRPGTANVGVVKVPDARLDALSRLFAPRKTTPADVTYVDLALAQGAVRAGSVPPDLLGQLRNADALLHVVRAESGAGAGSEAPGPWEAFEELVLEFTVADLTVVQRRLERLATTGRHGSPAERTQNAQEEEALRQIEPVLARGDPLRSVELDDGTERLLRGYRFLTQKPVLVLLNIDDTRLAEAEGLEAEARRRFAAPGIDVAVLAAGIEAEIGELGEEDAAAFMEEVGIAEPSRLRVIRLTYGLLGLISFFTVGEDECRAWTVRDGATAVDAAGVIHSDLARGFIRAEVVTYDELMSAGSLAEARRRGVLRSEGKTYRVRDGDVVHVLFNVARQP